MVSYKANGLIPNHPRNTEFYSHEEAKVLASTYFNIGKDLYFEINNSRNNNIKDMWKLGPAFVNISFSCEIVLKLIYENENGHMARGHKLYKDLYTKLSSDMQKLISDLTINFIKANNDQNYDLNKFISNLKKSEDTFTNERYSFEIIPGKSYGLECTFLYYFGLALNMISDSLT